jgi:hypothetical protein
LALVAAKYVLLIDHALFAATGAKGDMSVKGLGDG